MQQQCLIVRAGRLAFMLAAGWLTPSLVAQPFEEIYGPNTTSESAARRTGPVLVCPGGGLIAVGVQGANTANPNAYAVRTTPAGVTIFENTYDLGPGRIDRAEAVAQAANGSGFILAGVTRTATGTNDAFLMKISCTGVLLWTVIYDSGRAEGAQDIVEARTGDAAFGTAPGDLVVAGFATNPAGTQDALLFRTNAGGALLWNLQYDTGAQREQFRALTEARATVATTTGDIVAAGNVFFGGGTNQGYVARVNGNNGQPTGGAHCFASWGAGDSENFNAVIELQTPPAVVGHLVMAGATSSAATNSDVYLARSFPNPCAAVTQQRIGAPAAAVLNDESASDIRAVPSPVATGRLAFTGRAGSAGTTAYDAVLHQVDPTTLVPVAGAGNLIGDHGPGREEGLSLAPAGNGIVMGGFSDSDFQGVGDPRDLYLVAATIGGRTNCSIGWAPPNVNPAFPVAALATARFPSLVGAGVPVAVAPLNTRFVNCP